MVDFVEIETPLLFRKTSEGAKEFEVPFTDKDGQRYAYSLPQSPQQVKILIVLDPNFNPLLLL